MECGPDRLARLSVRLLPDTPAARVTAGLAVAVILTGTAIFAANRAERLTMDDVAGVYQVESTDVGNATDRLLFQRFTVDGRTWLEGIRLTDGPGGLEATITTDSARISKWSVDEGGRLCIGAGVRAACSTAARDPVTGDLTIGEQRLTRLRGAASWSQ